MLILFTTTPTADEAERLGNSMVAKRLAACVQILPKMTSVYFWEGKVQTDEEHLLLLKTTPEKYGELEAFINENHSYDVPEIVAVESAKVSPKYREWLENYIA
ncbi:MAG: divalent-cation tolerance protein CutA [Pyrinomonadaceae bacterium]